MKDTMLQTVEQIVSEGASHSVAHLFTEESKFNLPLVTVDGKKMCSFTFCDYLGLSQDQRLIKGAMDMVSRYGTYTAVSRSYLGLDITRKTEEALESIFNKPVGVLARTTLAHTAVLPVITNTEDAIVLDHQVHTSVRNATDMLRAYGNKVEMIRHNRMDQLEARIQRLSQQHPRVWYMADGIYSMYGDGMPCEEILDLLNRYPQFNVYVDDAHGMSWQGKNGVGYVLNNMPYHERMFLVTSLGKGFGSGGAAIVCPNQEMKQRIVYTGSPYIFTSPAEPPMLGAILASTAIHLSDELPVRQQVLEQKIRLFQNQCVRLGLPLIQPDNFTPIFFIGVGKMDVGIEVCKRLQQDGHLLSIGIYPAVPLNNTGMRATVTVHHTDEQIIGMLESMARILPTALRNNDSSIESVCRAFKMEVPEPQSV